MARWEQQDAPTTESDHSEQGDDAHHAVREFDHGLDVRAVWNHLAVA
jgi:hypothetical protein